MATVDGLNGADASVVNMVELYTSSSPVKFEKSLSRRTVPPAGALLHDPDAGLLTVTAHILLELLYVAVTLLEPAATPVTVAIPLVCPAGIVMVAGTVAFVTSELLKETVAEALGAEDKLTVTGPVPPTVTVNDVGDTLDTVGLVGVVPSVVS